MNEERRFQLATVPEVAQALRVTRPVVYALMRRGELESVKLGRARRIPWPAVEQLVKAKTV